ncbi:MAG: hypothetical protein VX642_00740 [Bdellovibrionota bacterium]|nr:hypothetical protein [Bdellovibrionota bacterium]
MNVLKIIFFLCISSISTSSYAFDSCAKVADFVTSFNETSGLNLKVACENTVSDYVFFQSREVQILKTSINGKESCQSESLTLDRDLFIVSFYPQSVIKIFQHLNQKLENPIRLSMIDRDKAGAKAFFDFEIPICFFD